MKHIFCLLIVLFLTCTRQLTEPAVMSLAGVVRLANESDFAGITVALYNAVPGDTATTNRLARFPNVGLDMTKDLAFDHRLVTPAFSTQTDEDGHYYFSNIPDGFYNLVALKSGYGWRYVLNVGSMSEVADMKLYAETTSSGSIETYTVWPAGQHVIVNGDLTVREGATLLIDRGCVIRIGNNYKIVGNGAIQVNGAADDMVWFTANVPSAESGYTAWRGLDASGALTINFARLDFASDGIKTSGSEFTISHSLFSNVGNIGALITRESTGVIENNVFFNCPTGIKIEGNSDAQVINNLFVSAPVSYYGTGLVINASMANVTDNLFRGISTACSFEFNTHGNFLHNYLEDCTTGLYVNKASFEVTKPVRVEGNIMRHCAKAAIDIYNCNSPVVEKNNIHYSGKGLLVSGYAVHWQESKSVSFPNNYWGLTEVNDVLRYIDVRDNDSATQPYQIHIEPILTAPQSDAGPR
ncbi:right-handed parallel beta-helix repeat-containing protein [candidate division KSB1 bacterium]|nr:right-handed parallel beta-helix repeat-containing protein [candidate division KSB1 bacterium]